MKNSQLEEFKNLERLYLERRVTILQEFFPSTLRGQILKEAHKSPLAADPGYQKMFASLKKKFFWPRMKKDALEYGKQCLVC